MTRYILIKETVCPGCGGDCWALNDESEICPACGGEGRTRVEVAEIPESVAGILVSQFGPDAIPFKGEPLHNKEITSKDYYGL